jgi:SET domain-containing protein
MTTKTRFKVRQSAIQGLGVFATERIRKGTRIIEYTGERISADEADARYEDHPKHKPILLFTVDKRTTIDAGVNGNDARFINHSCDPNCEPVIESRRVFINAVRLIWPGEELTYDYNLTRDKQDDEQTEIDLACHCGAINCRGTMLEPIPTRKKRKSKRATH